MDAATANSTGNQPADQALDEMLQQINAQAQQTVLQHFSVSPDFRHKFLTNVTTEVDRLALAGSAILRREFRQKLESLTATLQAIVHNCMDDANDINEELTLHMTVRLIAEAVEEYSQLISDRRLRQQYAEKLQNIETDIGSVKLPWARRLLERMHANDSTPAADRLQISSVFFDSKKL